MLGMLPSFYFVLYLLILKNFMLEKANVRNYGLSSKYKEMCEI